uniref:G-protein coupled receptors family 2 profile 2 domain-containing protein n=1 Tax=Sphaeramia orbicularis TaxID=375764 RepID=A0A672YT61_9TELE
MFVNVNFFYTKTKRTFDVVYFWTILFLFDWSGPCSRVSEQGLVCPAVSLSVVGGTFRRGVWSAFLGVGFVRSLSRSSKLCLSSGSVSRSCTEDGWSDVQPAYEDACAFAEHEEDDPQVKTAVKGSVYTAGYATSLASLISAIFVFAAKFHCTRNYIHINLFLSFILRASAVFIKDRVLFSDEDLDHCFMSTPSCKAAVAFFHFSILANYFWLLVEGLYLQTLLALTFVFHNKFFWCYLLIGWGLPTSIITAWILSRNFYDDRGCWDDTDVSFIWWIIKAPITASLLVNFIIFINVIRILVQKLRSPAVGGNDTGHFKRLAKSTLLLIPLFGMHYMVFAFLPENTGTDARIFIELGLGSFQGFVVALLYCFLNGEVRRSSYCVQSWTGGGGCQSVAEGALPEHLQMVKWIRCIPQNPVQFPQHSQPIHLLNWVQSTC